LSLLFPELVNFDSKNPPLWMSDIQLDASGLIMAICQDYLKKDILMVAWMNRESLFLTQQKGEMVFWSRSRKELWHKGGTSGNVLKVHSFALDCDGDALLFQVEALGDKAACHTGRRSCFYREHQVDQSWKVMLEPLFDPKKVYGK